MNHPRRDDIRLAFLAAQCLQADPLTRLRHRWEMAHRLGAQPNTAELPEDLATASRWLWELTRDKGRLAPWDEALRVALRERAYALQTGKRRKVRRC